MPSRFSTRISWRSIQPELSARTLSCTDVTSWLTSPFDVSFCSAVKWLSTYAPIAVSTA
ncbi:hypothetical protein L6R52_22750 [Myxococcota bacterium]|nr:hypothetical protein [Myxococcota bacterium]